MSLEVTLLGKTFKNPLLPASGPSVGSLHSLKFFNNSDVGGLVTKTISIKGAEVSKPCIVANSHTVYNTELWSEHDLTKWTQYILPELKKEINKPLIVCAGYTSEDFKQSIPLLETFADYFEVSTHYGKDALHDLVTTICSLTQVPVFIKLSPHVDDYIDFIKEAVACGAKGVVAINSVGPGVCIDLKSRGVKIGVNGGQSWISGPAIKPIALQRVIDIRSHFPDLPIIACGGVSSAEDVLEFVLAGADLVQMLSTALINGRQTYNNIVKELPILMNKYNIKSINSLRHTKLKLEPQGLGGYPIVDSEKCVLCKKCEIICPEIAMTVSDSVITDQNRCIRCGLCESRCPTEAIRGVL